MLNLCKKDLTKYDSPKYGDRDYIFSKETRSDADESKNASNKDNDARAKPICKVTSKRS